MYYSFLTMSRSVFFFFFVVELLPFLLLMISVDENVVGERIRDRTRNSTRPLQSTSRRPVYERHSKSDDDDAGFDDYFSFSESEKSGPNCSVRASCTTASRETPRTGDDIIERNCFCDDLCASYDDCCEDYTRSSESSVEILHLQQEVISCQPLLITFKDAKSGNAIVSSGRMFSVVSQCPTNYSEPFVSEKCQLGNSHQSDLFYTIPVTGRTSKILYLNYYCAICNGDTKVIFWTGTLDVCREKTTAQEGDQKNGNSIANMTNDRLKENAACRIVFDFPEGYRPRPCKVVIRKCNNTWTDRRTAKKCQDRSQPTSFVYKDKSNMVLRNKHCATCNYIREDETTCYDPSERGTQSPPWQPAPYNILIDFNSKSAKIRNELETTATVVLRECDLGFVYDPFTAICRPVFCRKDYRLTDSGCHPLDLSNSRGSESVGLLPCNKTIQLNESGYRLFSNRSAFVYSMKSWYMSGDYVLDNPYLYICVPFTSRMYNETVNTTIVMFQFDNIQSQLSFVGIIVSLVLLFILFLVYMIFSALRNTPGKCLICLDVSIFVGQLSFLFVTYQSPACFYLAAAMHYGYLASFFWMNVIAFDICRTFIGSTAASLANPGSHSKRFIFYSLYAWLTPLAIVGVCVTMDVLQLDDSFRPHYDEDLLCWITSRTSLLIFFGVPLAVILIVNIVFFGITIYGICSASRAAETATHKTHTKGQVIVYIKLSFVMGLTWIFAFIAALTDWIVLHYLFIFFNCLQGAFLCIIFVCSKKVFGLVKGKCSPQSKDFSNQQNIRKCQIRTEETSVPTDNSRIVAKETCM